MKGWLIGTSLLLVLQGSGFGDEAKTNAPTPQATPAPLTAQEEQEIIDNLDLLEKNFLFDSQVDEPEFLLQVDVRQQPTY